MKECAALVLLLFYNLFFLRLILSIDINNNEHDVLQKYPSCDCKLLLRDPVHKIIMDYSAKAASAEMVAMFYQNLNIYQNINYTGFSHKYFTRNKEFQELYGKYHVKPEELYDKEWYKFKVVRNPYSRAVSSYFHTMQFSVLKNPFFKFSNPMHDKMLKVNASFLEFYNYYLENKDKSNNFNFSGAGHFLPQSRKYELEYFLKFNKSIFNHIVKLENFDHDISIVNKESKQHYFTGLYKDTHSKLKINNSNIKFYGNYPYSLYRHREPSNYRLFYNHQTIALISYLFADDIYLYDYKF